MTTPADPRPPLILNDDWEKPPPDPGRVRAIVTASAAALAIVSLAFVSIHSVWTDERARSAQDWEAHQPVTAEPVAPAAPGESPWSPLASSPMPADHPLPPPPPPQRPQPSATVRSRPRVVVARAPGYLAVSSTPWSQVAVDGTVVGNTPQLAVRVTPGRHEVVLTRDGFAPHRAWVTIGSGATVRVTGIVLQPVTR